MKRLMLKWCLTQCGLSCPEITDLESGEIAHALVESSIFPGRDLGVIKSGHE